MCVCVCVCNCFNRGMILVASDRALASVSAAENAADNCMRLLGLSPQLQAESQYSSISDIASLEDSIEKEYNDREQRIESLELGIGEEMANLEKDLSLLKSLQKILNYGDDINRGPMEVDERRRNSPREIGGHAELYNELYHAHETQRLTSIHPQLQREKENSERKTNSRSQQMNKRRFYSERTGSIFRLPSLSSSESEASSEDGQILEEDTINKMSGNAPKVISHLQNRHIQVGCRIKMCCVIDGNPCPEISWFRNGKPLTLKNRHFIVSMVSSHQAKGLC